MCGEEGEEAAGRLVATFSTAEKSYAALRFHGSGLDFYMYAMGGRISFENTSSAIFSLLRLTGNYGDCLPEITTAADEDGLPGSATLPGCPGFWTLCPEVGAAGVILVGPLLLRYNIHIEANSKLL